MHIFINGLAASAGGGLTYIRNVVPHLSASGVTSTFLLSASLRDKLGPWQNVNYVTAPEKLEILQRFRYEQREMPALIRQCGADVLVSAGNFALRKSPVPQILLSRNALYLSSDFMRDLRQRKEYKTWIDTRLRGWFAKRSIGWADVTVAPSEAFARELRQWTGRDVISIYHGFDRDSFFGSNLPLPAEISSRMTSKDGTLKLLFVSHYNYYRNFETIFRAIALIKHRLPGQTIRLFLTCRLRSDENPGDYQAEGAAHLIQQLDIENEIVELGTVPYELLHHVYSGCDLYVTAAYAETFAHPLVEAMSSGLPVIASDLEVHREICDGAAVFFARVSPEELANRIVELHQGLEQRHRMAQAGREQSKRFSWSGHVKELLSLAESLVGGRPA
ncbi:MAG TPA: glycosyltransferase family 1 protein [Terriglobales bacterium]|nr:glycosyltransferase family 1 protein [Terriglobales bacterium]